MLSEKQTSLLQTGSYAKKQLFSYFWPFTFAHGARFKKGAALVKCLGGNSLLDYGCGDGTFLIYIMHLIENKTGADLDRTHLERLKERLKDYPGFSFVPLQELKGKQFDLVTCMEVLEHCPPGVYEQVLQELASYLKADGHLIISVPIETGPTLLIKQFFRSIAGLLRFGTYQYGDRYRWGDFLKMIFANRTTAIVRDYYEVGPEGQKYFTVGHKGLNWMRVQQNLEQIFRIKAVNFSPFFWPFSWGNSQAWFVCQKK